MSAAPLPDASSPAGAVNLEQYTLTSALEIAHQLRALVLSGQMATVYGNHGKTFVLTRLLEVDQDSGLLKFDWGGDAAANQRLLQSEHNVFVCSPEGIKTQFAVGTLSQGLLDGRPVFVSALPQAVIRLQRREFYRVRTRVSEPPLCQIPDFPGGALALPLYDISVGGMALTLPEPELAGFEIGQTYHGCSVDLAPVGVLPLGFEVRNRQSLLQKSGATLTRIGCRFIGLSTARENMLQRFVALLERERLALLR